MKIAFVIQRYGEEIIGGAEYFTRLIAEKMIKFHEIEILTTCAKGYHVWENEYPQGKTVINGIPVRRFKNTKYRNMERFTRIQQNVFDNDHILEEEMQWVDEQGPYCPDLIQYIQLNKDEYDIFVFFTYRYFPSYYGIHLVKEKAILVPFAENDPALDLMITADQFNDAAGIIYSTPEERELINNRILLNKNEKMWSVIGCGINTSHENEKSSDKRKRYIFYLGRIEGSKGCYELFDYYFRLITDMKNPPDLFLAGFDAIGVPKHEKIQYLGFVSEKKKAELLFHADFLIMPSPYESFSIVTLESLSCGTPVLVNEECAVLKGHCLRSNAGLWYRNYDDFLACSRLLIINDNLRKKMGQNGIKYIKNNYSWDLIEQKYLNIFKCFEKCGILN